MKVTFICNNVSKNVILPATGTLKMNYFLNICFAKSDTNLGDVHILLAVDMDQYIGDKIELLFSQLAPQHITE
jgi:hypothetical protein